MASRNHRKKAVCESLRMTVDWEIRADKGARGSADLRYPEHLNQLLTCCGTHNIQCYVARFQHPSFRNSDRARL
jgi:hypothetical protein